MAGGLREAEKALVLTLLIVAPGDNTLPEMLLRVATPQLVGVLVDLSDLESISCPQSFSP